VTEESDRGVSCNTTADCSNGSVCCAVLPNVDLNVCPIKAKPMLDSSISTTCRTKACAGSEYQICTGTGQCGTKKCTAAQAPGAFMTSQILNFGVCL
jgi:hypothetical protein